MKVILNHYAHQSNGMSLQIVPETEAESELLRAFWSHGQLETGHPCKAPIGGCGFYIAAFKSKPDEKGTK